MSTLFQKQAGRSAHVSFRRSPHDRGAQVHFASFAGLFVFFIALLISDIALMMSHSVDATVRSIATGLISVIVLGGCVRALLARWKEQSGKHRALPAVSEDMRLQLAGQTVTFALLLQRAGSEECLAEKELHSSIIVTTRTESLERLKQHHLYADLLPQARDLFSLPNGYWSEEDRARIFVCWEDFEALRWAMSLSRELVSIENAPKHGWRDVLDIARDTERAIRFAKLRPAADIRRKRDEAKSYLDRCISRMVTAGLIDAVPENANWQRKMEEIYEQDAQADVMDGHEYVREVDAPTLVWTAHRASRRCEMLSVLSSIAAKQSPIAELQAYLERKLTPLSHSEEEVYSIR